MRSCRLAASSAKLGRAEEDGRLGVVELVAQARARRAACSAASGSVPPSRRRRRRRRAPGSSPVSVATRSPGDEPRLEQTGREPVGASIEIGVGRHRAETVDRDASRGRPGAVADPTAERQAHSLRGTPSRPRRSARAAPRRRGGRRPGRARRGHPGCAARAGPCSASPRRRLPSRGGRASAQRSRSTRSSASNAAPAAACALQASNGCAVALAVRAGSARRSARPGPARARSRRTGAGVAPLVSSFTVCSGIGNASGPPGVVQARTSLSTRSGAASASSCATMPPRLVPSTCARSTPASSSTCAASAASSAAVYGPGGASLSPMPRLSKRITSNDRASGSTTGSQPQRA